MRAHPRGPGPGAGLRPVSAGCLLLALGLCVGTGWGAVPGWAAPLLALGLTCVEVVAQRLPAGRQRWPLSLVHALLSAAFVLGPGAWSVAAAGVAVAATQALRHAPQRKRDFEVARCLVATAAGAALVDALGGGVGAAGAGMAAYWAADCLLIAVAVARTSRRPFGSLLRSGATATALPVAGSVAVGLLGGFLLAEAPLGLLGLAVPLVLLWSAHLHASRRSAEARLFAELARGQEREASRSQDVSAHVVVTAAARLLGGADVELVVLAADGPVCFVGDESGRTQRRRVGPDVFDEPWVLRALGEHRVLPGRDDGRPCVTAVLGEPDQPQAVLRVRRAAAARSFDRRDLRLTEVLVRQAEAWLAAPALAASGLAPGLAPGLASGLAGPGLAGSGLAGSGLAGSGLAARALVDGVPDAADRVGSQAPVLLVLRESADRLVRVAERSGDVAELVEELHLVEQAVASLLGGLALSSAPPAATTAGSSTGPGPSGTAAAPQASGGLLPVRRGAEWTTTGVLT